MTPADVITEVRRLISDTTGAQRYSDTLLLGFVNQTLKRMVTIRPDLFLAVDDVATAADQVLQSLPSDAVRLVEIYQVKNGSAITEAERETFDRTYPGWVNEASAIPKNYMRHVRSATKFFLYPRPTAGVVLIAEYVKTPPNYTTGDTITILPDAYFPHLVDGTVFLAQSIDNEYVLNKRAELFYNMFVSNLTTGLQSRPLTDYEDGGLDPKQVI
jgi:hypothetical protein